MLAQDSLQAGTKLLVMWNIGLKISYLQHSYYNSGTVKVQIRIRGTLYYVCGVLVHWKYVVLQVT